ncbi:MAG: hypothetical protein AAB380_05350 [Verrucomicrobiota bacterium]
MNPDDFEQCLQRQPMREMPPAWRTEILTAARASGSRPSTLDSRPSPWWRELLWPCPQAWAGVAAVWLVILAVNFTTRETTSRNFARQAAPPSPETLMVLRQQHLLLAELVERPEPRAADQPKSVPPRPHSQRREEMLMA